MALSNRSFEAAGASFGLAANWTTTVVGTVDILADFSGGAVPPIPVETFETGYGADDYETEITQDNSVLSAFGSGDNTTDHEGFETGWGNDDYIFQLSSVVGTVMGDGGEVETFENGYDNDDYLWELDPLALIEASMTGGGTVETFESGYGNDTYLTALSGTTSASMDGNGSTVEDFEQVSPIRTFVADSGSNLFIAAGHAMPLDHPVNVKGPGLPSGFAAGVLYYVLNPTTDNFQLGLTPDSLGGTPITITTDGKGTVFGDPKQFWNEVE